MAGHPDLSLSTLTAKMAVLERYTVSVEVLADESAFQLKQLCKDLNFDLKLVQRGTVLELEPKEIREAETLIKMRLETIEAVIMEITK